MKLIKIKGAMFRADFFKMATASKVEIGEEGRVDVTLEDGSGFSAFYDSLESANEVLDEIESHING